MTSKENRLIHESSPYLLQHARNPVDWYPWRSEALEKARLENKPILLSIGYAACHWCHVMAHESFEDPETAAVMNQYFVNIKVDREERPDLDKVYQATHYLLTRQNGGWPLTVFLTPDDLAPFYSGTYFPREARFQLPAFRDLLLQIAQIYHARGADIKKQTSQLLNILHPAPPVISDLRLNLQPVQHALQNLKQRFDSQHGGFDGAPKFPQAPKLAFLLLNHSPMAQQTLMRMAQSGLYDQVGGGFFRYAVDDQWRIPHFEKMLYDNAQLLNLYALAFHEYREPLFAAIIQQTAEWVMSTMQSPSGGYYSSMDADADGKEGDYYLWDQNELRASLHPEEFAMIEHYFGLNNPPVIDGRWHLAPAESLVETAAFFNISLPRAIDMLNSAKHKLRAARAARKTPEIDTKILTAANALMAKSLFTAGAILRNPRMLDSAKKAMAMIRQSHWSGNRLLAAGGSEAQPLYGYLDDYAFLIDALLSFLEVEWNPSWLAFAIVLADSMIAHFTDHINGGFYFTADDHEQLLYRPKTTMDEAIPAGNAVAARSLLILGSLLAEPRYLQAAEKALHASWPLLTQYPAEHGSFLIALQDFLQPPSVIVIRGPESGMEEWKNKAKTLRNYVLAIPDSEKGLPANLASKASRSSSCAYICQGTRCLNVVETLEDLPTMD